MQIQQFHYSRDNLGYLVYSGFNCSDASSSETGRIQGIAIDGGDSGAMVDFAREHEIDIKYVTNTHAHHDHIGGNQGLLELTGARFLDCKTLEDKQKILLCGESLEVMRTPGHTDDSICFKADGFLVTGDTLFNGTVGNCFSGDLKGFFRSLSRLVALPGGTKIYAGHDYVKESLEFAASIEGDRPEIQAYLAAYDSKDVVSTLEDELKVNPFVRFNSKGMISKLKEKNMPGKTAEERFISIMENF